MPRARAECSYPRQLARRGVLYGLEVDLGDLYGVRSQVVHPFERHSSGPSPVLSWATPRTWEPRACPVLCESATNSVGARFAAPRKNRWTFAGNSPSSPLHAQRLQPGWEPYSNFAQMKLPTAPRCNFWTERFWQTDASPVQNWARFCGIPVDEVMVCANPARARSHEALLLRRRSGFRTVQSQKTGKAAQAIQRFLYS
jgi:hypothetical protein